MNREALIQTIRVLEEVQKFHLSFDLTTFVGVYDEDGANRCFSSERGGDYEEPQKFEKAMEKEQFILIPHNCGCTACATGYAGLDPWFRERGFMTTPGGDVEFRDPVSGEVLEQGWWSLMAFYDLADEEATWLFGPEASRDPTDPVEVIGRIEDFLEAGGLPDDWGLDEATEDRIEDEEDLGI